jgi:hypothetical protein
MDGKRIALLALVPGLILRLPPWAAAAEVRTLELLDLSSPAKAPEASNLVLPPSGLTVIEPMGLLMETSLLPGLAPATPSAPAKTSMGGLTTAGEFSAGLQPARLETMPIEGAAGFSRDAWAPIIGEKTRIAAGDPSIETPVIRSELTAHERAIASHATRLAEPRLRGKILDYGAGKGKDTEYLAAKGHHVRAYDPYFFPVKPHGDRFDWVLLNYVLNVIPSRSDRRGLLQELRGLLNAGGHALVSVLKKEEIDSRVSKAPHEWDRHEDGWVKNKNLFEHGYTRDELSDELSSHGFQPVHWFDDEPDSQIAVTKVN